MAGGKIFVVLAALLVASGAHSAQACMGARHKGCLGQSTKAHKRPCHPAAVAVLQIALVTTLDVSAVQSMDCR